MSDYTIDPNATYIARSSEDVRGRTYNTRGFSMTIAAILMVVGGVQISLSTFVELEGEKNLDLLLRLGIIFCLAGLFFAWPYLINHHPAQPYTYRPGRQAGRCVFKYRFAGAFIGFFLSIFYDIILRSDKKDAQELMYLVYFFLAIFGGFYLFQIIRALIRMIREGKWGVSNIDLAGRATFRPGETVAGTFSNAQLGTGHLDVTLFCLQDHAAYNYRGEHAKKKTTSGFLTELHYRAEQNIPIYNGSGSFSFTLPSDTPSTQYHPLHPVYWTLEVRNQRGFRAAFFVEVA